MSIRKEFLLIRIHHVVSPVALVGLLYLGGCAGTPVAPEIGATPPQQPAASAVVTPPPVAPTPAAPQVQPPSASVAEPPAAARAVQAPALDEAQRAKLAALIEELVSRHAYDPNQLEALFQGFAVDQSVIRLMTKPAEAMPWHRYRRIFITPNRIAAGNAFWRKHERLLNQVSQTYQVPPELILAILGIETFYGKNVGTYPVLEANASLFLGYPRRSDFFRQQLVDFLLLSRQEGLDPWNTKGSYAGAMGMSQFISSSYRAYAVDGDGDGRRDLWGSIPDITASVANYFKVHGWRLGQPVAIPAQLTPGAQPQPFLSDDLRPRYTLEQLAGAGITPMVDTGGTLGAQLPVSLLKLDGTDGPEYFITFHNFYVITRYNRSPLYAMAAVEMMQNLQQPGEEFDRSLSK
ncbi:MAG: lytic murein transglycosylase B [Pseudomonadota bacterium]